VPHYANNKAVGTAKEGMCFTIEPMINLGSYKDKTWLDDWTSTTADGRLSAQFGRFRFPQEDWGLHVMLTFIFVEHTLLVTKNGVEVLTARLPTSPGGPAPMPEAATATEVPPKEDAPVVGEPGEKEGVQVDEQGSGAVLAS